MYVLCIVKEEGKTTAITIAFDLSSIISQLRELNSVGLVAELYIFTTIERLLDQLEKELNNRDRHG